MRKIALVLTLTLIGSAVLAGAAHGVVPKAGVPRIYEGETSQGKGFDTGFIKRTDGSLGLKYFDFHLLLLTCSLDQSVQRWSVGFSFGGRGFDLDGRTLNFVDHDSFIAITLQGKVKATTIDGTLLRLSTAALTEDEEPQLCTTGDLTWTAERTVPPVGTTPSRLRASVRPGATIVHRLGHGARVVMTRLS